MWIAIRSLSPAKATSYYTVGGTRLTRHCLRSEFEPELLPERDGRTGQRRQRQAGVVLVEQPVQRRAARLHLRSHPRLGQVLRLHFLLDLPRDDTFHGRGSDFLEDRLFRKEIVKACADMFVCHAPPL